MQTNQKIASNYCPENVLSGVCIQRTRKHTHRPISEENDIKENIIANDKKTE